jgi:thioredoxin-related protein
LRAGSGAVFEAVGCGLGLWGFGALGIFETHYVILNNFSAEKGLFLPPKSSIVLKIMNKILFAAAFLALSLSYAFVLHHPAPPAATADLKWYTWEEAVALNKQNPKKIFVDVYTDWCGWCKRMDKTTFADPQVVEYLNANFYPVKLNAEQKADINFNGELFKYVDNNGRGVHSLAYALLDGQLGYPTYVYLNEKFERIMISPGYKEPAAIMKEFQFAKEEKYQSVSWEDYQKGK